MARAKREPSVVDAFALGFPSYRVGASLLVHADAFAWLAALPECSLHAVVTDPPYGVKEYEPPELARRASGVGGVWRIPPSFDGHTRAPLPRFTALTPRERAVLEAYFADWGALVLRALRPGGHVFLAGNAFLSQLVFGAVARGGLEFRGELIRLVRTLRGGDRPKNAEVEFEDVTSLPRGCYEPWGIFRKPLEPGARVSDCLRAWQTGALRRSATGGPFEDVIVSERTPLRERRLAAHPSLKPQSLLRKLVYAALPLGVGVVADPFMGSGSTVAAAEHLGLTAVGVERHADFVTLARQAVPKLAVL